MEVITQPLENAETGKSNKKQQKSQSILFLFFAIALLRVVESHTSPSRYHRVQAAPAVIILYVCISNPLCIYVCVVIYLECMNCRVVQPTDNAAVVVVSVLFFFSLLRSCELVGFGAQCVMYKMTQHCFQFQFLSLFLLPIFFCSFTSLSVFQHCRFRRCCRRSRHCCWLLVFGTSVLCVCAITIFFH